MSETKPETNIGTAKDFKRHNDEMQGSLNSDIKLKDLIEEHSRGKLLSREAVLNAISFNQRDTAKLGFLQSKAEIPKSLADLKIKYYYADFLVRFIFLAQLEEIYQAEITATPKDWFVAQVKEAMRLGVEFPPIDFSKNDQREFPLPEAMVQEKCPNCYGSKFFSKKCKKCHGTGVRVAGDGKSVECNHCRQGKTHLDCAYCEAHGFVYKYRIQGRQITHHTEELIVIRLDKPNLPFETPTKNFLPIWHSPLFNENDQPNINLEDFPAAKNTLLQKLKETLVQLKNQRNQSPMKILSETNQDNSLPYYKREAAIRKNFSINKCRIQVEIIPIYHIQYERNSKYKISFFSEKEEAHLLSGDIWLTGWESVTVYKRSEKVGELPFQ